MRRLVLALVALTACTETSRLEGKWRGVSAEGVPSEATASANTFAQTMTLDVKGDVIGVTANGEKQTGHFVVDSDEKSTLVLHTDRDGEGDAQTFVFSGDKDKTVKWSVNAGKSTYIVFARESAEAR